MTLSKSHREALLNVHKKAVEEYDKIGDRIASADTSHQDLIPMWEIDQYIARMLIKIAQDAIVENEIDY